MKAKKISLLGVLGAVSLVLSFLEGTLLPDIPFLPVGAKLGLSNIITALSAKLFGLSAAMYITALKVGFAFITRGASAAFMSFCGGVLSALTMALMIRHEGKNFSYLSVGVVGATAHNLGQLVSAAVLTDSAAIFNYGKYLLLFAIITGSLTGMMLLILMPRVEKISREIYKQ